MLSGCRWDPPPEDRRSLGLAGQGGCGVRLAARGTQDSAAWWHVPHSHGGRMDATMHCALGLQRQHGPQPWEDSHCKCSLSCTHRRTQPKFSSRGAQPPRRRICPPRLRCLLTPHTHKLLCPPSGRAPPRRACVRGRALAFGVGNGALDGGTCDGQQGGMVARRQLGCCIYLMSYSVHASRSTTSSSRGSWCSARERDGGQVVSGVADGVCDLPCDRGLGL